MVIIDKKKCLRCGACVGVCPFLVLSLTDHGIEVDIEKCKSCGLCIKTCPVGAICVRK